MAHTQKTRRARPQSIMALEFSAALDNVFGLPTEQDLALEQKRQSLQIQSAELAQLQARIRALDEKLQQTQSQSRQGDSITRSSQAPAIHRKAIQNNAAQRRLVVGQGRPQHQLASSESEASSEGEGRNEKDSETEESSSEEEQIRAQQTSGWL